MNKPIFRAVLLCLSVAAAPVAMAAKPTLLPDGSRQIAEGVFERTDADGTVFTAAYGTAGAAYDRQRLNARLSEIKARADASAFTKADSDELAATEEALAGLPDADVAAAGPKPATVMSGVLCSRFYYGLDDHFVVGSLGATAVTRAGVQLDGFGPPPNYTSSIAYAEAQVKPYGASAPTTTDFHSAQFFPATAIADLNFGATAPGFPSTTTCTGRGYSYVTLHSSLCSGGTGFVSLLKTYSTCASVP